MGRDAEHSPARAQSVLVVNPELGRKKQPEHMRACTTGFDLKLTLAVSPEVAALERHCKRLQLCSRPAAGTIPVAAASTAWSAEVCSHDVFSSPRIFAARAAQAQVATK